jgi:hypothetical protein
MGVGRMPDVGIDDLYRKAHDDMKFNADKAWETVKFHITLSSTLVTVTIGLFGFVNSLSVHAAIKTALTGALVLFPIIMLRIISVGKSNFERECSRMYEAIATVMKIEEKLPSREKLNSQNVLFGEDKFIPKRYEEERKKKNWKDTDEFIKDMLTGSHDNFYRNMRRIFPVFAIVSYFLLAMVSVSFLILLTSLAATFLAFLVVLLL